MSTLLLSHLLPWVFGVGAGAVAAGLLFLLIQRTRALRAFQAQSTVQAGDAEASRALDSLLTYSLDIIYFKDRESRFVRYSRSLLHHLGVAETVSLIGKSDFDCYSDDRARPAFNDEQEILRTGKPMVGKLEQTHHGDGSVSWILTTKMPWRDQHGQIIGTVGISRDITSLKRAESELAHERDLLRALLDASPDQIYFKDLQSRFIRVSRAQAEGFRAGSPEDLVGRSDFDYFTTEHARPAYEDEQEIIRTGRPLIGKVEKETWADGRQSWALTAKMPLRDRDGKIIGTLGISKNITDLKDAEARLEKAQKQLLEASRQAGMAEVATSVLHNVGNVLNSVNVSTSVMIDWVAASKLTKLGRLSELLQANAADLAGFLTRDDKGRKIPEYLALLNQQLVDERVAIGQELENLRKNVEHIKEIVSMQQSYAKVGGLTELVDIAEVVEDAVRINFGTLSRHDLVVEREYLVRPRLMLDRHKLMQIVVNLVSNAKHACEDSGRTDGRIAVRIAQEGDRLKICVTDNGLGIPEENLTRIFAHGFTTRKQGHGFGLHSGSLVARDLGGTLTASSPGPGHGATFTLDLPGPKP